MGIVGERWRCHKCSMKKQHYYKYDTDDERWKYRPTTISDDQFKILLEYWNCPAIEVLFCPRLLCTDYKLSALLLCYSK